MGVSVKNVARRKTQSELGRKLGGQNVTSLHVRVDLTVRSPVFSSVEFSCTVWRRLGLKLREQLN